MYKYLMFTYLIDIRLTVSLRCSGQLHHDTLWFARYHLTVREPIGPEFTISPCSVIHFIMVQFIVLNIDFGGSKLIAGSDYGEDDLEVNVYSSHLDESEVSPPKHYKSFQPVIKLQPTDLIYREENSRAAPRKGIDVCC